MSPNRKGYMEGGEKRKGQKEQNFHPILQDSRLRSCAEYFLSVKVTVESTSSEISEDEVSL